MQGSQNLSSKSDLNLNDSSHETLRFLLALKMIKGIGNITALKLLKAFQSPHQIFSANVKELSHAGLNSNIIQQITNFDFTCLDPVLAWESDPQRHIIDFKSPYYPALLTQINNPPIILFVMGNPEILTSPQVAIVGTRSPTPQGLESTRVLCQGLVEQGLTITSGLAMGIDGEAHRSSLKAGGYTVAVTGTGLNRVYPAKHRELAYLILEKGLLVSEKFPDEPLDGGSFPQRNRIIAGLCLGTLVVEAAQKSGSLITANHALEQGREVYAIPGSIHNPLAKGCHHLIKQGAKLVESVEDILEDLPSNAKVHINRLKEDNLCQLSKDDEAFLKCLDYEVTTLDTIVTRSQLTVEAVTNKLLELELEGWIINSVGGYIRR